MTLLRSRIYDTSAILRLSNREKGYEKIRVLLDERKDSVVRDKASALSAFEFLFSVGRSNGPPGVKSLTIFENILDFIPTEFETAQRAAFLKLRYPELNLSMADAIILQTGIENDFEVITCDREWSKVSEAKVRVV